MNSNSKKRVLESQRLYFREMEQEDFSALCKTLQDAKAMYAYEGAFSDEEVRQWLERQIARYKMWHFRLWAVVLKESDRFIGQCGLTMQPWKNEEVLEIGYLFERQFWHQGFATEAAVACKKYAFEKWKAQEVCSIIRDNNEASIRVALRNGMHKKDSGVKHYKGIVMPHSRYVITRQEYADKNK